eukprot:s972_g13.t1
MAPWPHGPMAPWPLLELAIRPIRPGTSCVANLRYLQCCVRCCNAASGARAVWQAGPLQYILADSSVCQSWILGLCLPCNLQVQRQGHFFSARRLARKMETFSTEKSGCCDAEHVPWGQESAAYWLDPCAEKEVQDPQSSIELQVPLPSHAAFLELTSVLGQDILCCLGSLKYAVLCEEVHEKERRISATVFINWTPVYLQVRVLPAAMSSVLEFKDLGRHSVVHFHRVCHTIYDLLGRRFLRGQAEDSEDDESNFSSTESAMRIDDVSVLLEEDLCQAVQRGDVQSVERLLVQNAQQGSRQVLNEISAEHGGSPLLIAAKNARLDLLTLLLDASADLHGRDATQWTALHFAARTAATPHCTSCVQLLLARRADAFAATELGYLG